MIFDLRLPIVTIMPLTSLKKGFGLPLHHCSNRVYGTHASLDLLFLTRYASNSRVLRPLRSYSHYEGSQSQGIPDIAFNQRETELLTLGLLLLVRGQ